MRGTGGNRKGKMIDTLKNILKSLSITNSTVKDLMRRIEELEKRDRAVRDDEYSQMGFSWPGIKREYYSQGERQRKGY